MNVGIETFLLLGSLLLFASVYFGNRAYKFGVPTLIIFLLIGMLAGSEGIIGIPFDDPKLTQFIGIVSLNFILFSGGLDTNFKSVKPILKEGIALSTFGVFFTAFSLGGIIYYLTDFTIWESLLLGSIVSSTDAAAVFSILRSNNLNLRSNLKPTLELESGSNDPMAYVLTILFTTLVMQPELSLWSMVLMFFKQMIFGAVLGFLFGKLSKWIINKIELGYDGLYPVLVIALMFITFSATDHLGGNGFLAIYICAVYLGNQDLIHKNTIIKMYDGFAWLMQIILFLTLGLLVFPSRIVPVLGVGLAISLSLIFIARPIGVFISTAFFKMKLRRRLYISWVGLRGAVPIVFATYPLIAGVEKADMIFNIVFFISLTSVLLQGTTIPIVAKWLNVAIPENDEEGEKPISKEENLISYEPKANFKRIYIQPDHFAANQKIVDLHLPKEIVIALVQREGLFFVPNGGTKIKAGDSLIFLSDKKEDFDIAENILKYNLY